MFVKLQKYFLINYTIIKKNVYLHKIKCMTKIKNIMISEETHIKVIELKTKIYKETGQLLTMEKVIIYLLDNAKI